MRGEQVDLLMTSIFDRSSSSSEAGPDTPGTFQSAQAPWHDDEIFEDALDAIPQLDHSIQRFTPRSVEDIGYESGREDGQTRKSPIHPHISYNISTTTSIQVCADILNPATKPPKLQKWPWLSLKSLLTLNIQDQVRGRLSPAMHVSSSPLPYTARLSAEHASGLIHSSSTTPSRIGSPGSAGGDAPRSRAELSLSEISKRSPPPSREGRQEDGLE